MIYDSSLTTIWSKLLNQPLIVLNALYPHTFYFKASKNSCGIVRDP